ncbi:hypothetical protein [Mucilaginibacter aquariorum]|uniref:Aerotolerance regulator N-terminal domain-containing protein n=1 Tax=Mucilaginibacter aquariorum TaxID=2967225 RepID=A0ABT1T6F9_9SPHI|nr:hypothetical protein [Mucilaginibacter aquariorum]MCQ6960195.1 hypothetical protein [Mucilaginibacter aquariorum]
MQSNWPFIVIALCILLALGFIWLEYRRANNRFLLLRIVAAIIATAALACIILPITYNSSVTKRDDHKAVLPTNGFDADSIGDDSAIFTTDLAIKKAYPKAKLINGLDELSQTDRLHVYGYGLSSAELQQLDSLSLVFHPSKVPAGVTQVNWNGRLKAGEALHIQGQYNNTSAQKIKLVLRGLNTGLDSVILSPNVQSSFDLSAIPKTTGKVVFSLYADAALQGNIPVQIDAVKPLKVLMLSASPDFESKFLKNWLSENGYAVALRSAISKDKFNSEYINIDQFNLNKISEQTLGRFDVVIGDLSILNALSPTESGALKQEIADKGLGLIVRADSTGKTSWLQKYFPVDRASGKESAPAPLIINGNKSQSKLSYGLAHIVYQNGTQPLVKTAQDRVLASSAISGSGKVVFTTLNNTFSWMLSGNKGDYSALWSVLITKAVRKNDAVEIGIELLSPPYISDPVTLQISQGKSSPIIINGQEVALVQNPWIPFEYDLLYWPQTAGWQSLKQNDQASSWYTYARQDWKTVQNADKLSATKKYANTHKISDIVTKQIQQKIRIDVPKIYFYILLLVACTFLWIETKFS